MTAAAATGLFLLSLLVMDRRVQTACLPCRLLPSWEGVAVLIGASASTLGVFLCFTGAWMPSLLFVLGCAGILTFASNAKRRVLGEPLVFTDLALVGAVFRYPHFYLSALRPWQVALIAVGVVLLLLGIVGFLSGNMALRFLGFGIALAGGVLHVVALRLLLANDADFAQDVDRDIRQHGLVPTLIGHWYIWKRLPALETCPGPLICGEPQLLVLVVQCESFADPTAIFGKDEAPLPGLTRARALAWRAGRLMVSGFGAYTMRTEFGVLFGIPESTLGLRRFDPFLTAAPTGSWALPNRLGGAAWSKYFIHPHDMRFYGRNELMPAAGFDALIGTEHFAKSSNGEGRYVTDEAVCDKLLEIAASEDGSSFMYVVTIENHGPWSAEGERHAGANKQGYMRLLRRSDAMLARLIDEVPRLGRPVVLCFFGDHRPSIPADCIPGGEKHTPYVLLKFNERGEPISSPGAGADLTPANLHAEILHAIGSGSR